MEELEELIYRKNMREKAGIYLAATFLYMLFFSWGLMDSIGGIAAGLFVVLTILYFGGMTYLLGYPIKGWTLVFPGAILLLGISQVTFASAEVHGFNFMMVLLLLFIWTLAMTTDISKWRLGHYILAFFERCIACIESIAAPFQDFAYVVSKDKDSEMAKKRRQSMFYVFLGLVVGIPLVLIMLVLLMNSDLIFKTAVENISLPQLSTRLIIIVLETFFLGWYLYSHMTYMSKTTIGYTVKEPAKLHVAMAITIYSMLAALYMVFSFVQIGGLMLKQMKLPEGETYASYARQGFFTLLFVCALNILFVIIGKMYFQRHPAIQVILNIICGCTVIMILASALKMYMYIDAYGFTRLRYKVVISLFMISVIMIGTVIWLNSKKYPLLIHVGIVILMGSLTFAWSNPDATIAKYNLEHLGTLGFVGYEISSEMESSLDAVSVVVSYGEEHPDAEILKSCEGYAEGEENAEILTVSQALECYRKNARYRKQEEKSWKDYNFGEARARKLLGIE